MAIWVLLLSLPNHQLPQQAEEARLQPAHTVCAADDCPGKEITKKGLDTGTCSDVTCGCTTTS
jgi:hypothetical protein